MAVTVYARFPLMRSGNLGGDILQREPIKASTALALLRGVQRGYVGENLRQFVDAAPVWGHVTAATGYEMVIRASAEFGQARKTIRVAVDSEDCNWQVEVYNAARTVLLAGPLTATSVGRVLDVGAMTLASTHQEVLVEVSVKRGGAPATGTLWSVHCVEKDVVLSDLTLNFLGIDEAAVAADQALSTSLLQDLSTSIDQSWAQRTMAASLTYDRRNIRRVVAYERGVWPMLVRLEPGATEITVFLRHQVYDQSVTYGASMVRLQQATGYAPPTDVVTATVTVTGAEVTTELVVPVGPAEGEEVAVLFLSALSDQGTAVVIVGSASGTPVGHLAGWTDTALTFNALSAAPIADGIPTYAIEVRSYVPPAAVGTSVHDIEVHPPTRQVLRSWDSGLFAQIVGPRTDADTGTARTGGGVEDVAYYIPLGYSDLSSVEVRVTGTTTPRDIGGRYNAGAAPSAGAGLGLVRRAEQIFAQRVRVHGYAGVGEVEDAAQVDGSVLGLAWHGAGSASGAGEAPADPAWARTPLLAAWSDACAWHVGFDSRLEDAEQVAMDRTGVICRVLLAVTTRGVNRREYNVSARLTGAPAAGAAVDVTGTTVQGAVMAHARQKAHGADPDPVGYLLGYFDWETGYQTIQPRVHSMRGLVPATLWDHTRLLYLTCELQDAAPQTHRRVTLQLSTSTPSVHPGNIQAAVIVSAMLTTIPGVNLDRVATV
jgi:hypothetical protein